MPDQDMRKRHRTRPNDATLLAEIKRRFDYDAQNGRFIWKEPLRNIKKVAGDIVGGQGHQRYASVFVLNHRFKVHRLIWLWHYGIYPSGDIDHVNGNTTDNRIENLRIATSAQNAANRLRKSKHGTGVCASPDGKFAARITVPGTKERLYLGRFNTHSEAEAAYIGASAVLHGEFSLAKSRTNLLNRGGRGVQSPLDRITNN